MCESFPLRSVSAVCPPHAAFMSVLCHENTVLHCKRLEVIELYDLIVQFILAYFTGGKPFYSNTGLRLNPFFYIWIVMVTFCFVQIWLLCAFVNISSLFFFLFLLFLSIAIWLGYRRWYSGATCQPCEEGDCCWNNSSWTSYACARTLPSDRLIFILHHDLTIKQWLFPPFASVWTV